MFQTRQTFERTDMTKNFICEIFSERSVKKYVVYDVINPISHEKNILAVKWTCFPKATLSLKHPVQQRVKLNETLRCCDKFHFMRQKLIRINKRFPNFSKAVQVIYLFVFPNFDTLFETALED